MARFAAVLSVWILAVAACSSPTIPSEAPAASEQASDAASAAASPSPSEAGVVARFRAMASDPALSYRLASLGQLTVGPSQLTAGGAARVDGGSMAYFAGLNGGPVDASAEFVTIGDRTVGRVNEGRWADISQVVRPTDVWLGRWATGAISELGTVTRSGEQLHELHVEGRESPGLIPSDTVITGRAISVFVRDDGTPVAARELALGTLDTDQGQADVRLEMSDTISALGEPQAIEMPAVTGR